MTGRRAAIARIVGLPVAMTAVMFGIVFVSNPALYGVVGVVGGLVLLAAGGMGTVRIMGREPEGDTDT